MVEALNHFLARTTVDPSIKKAYLEGRIEAILEESGFTPEEAEWIGGLPSDGFQSFLENMYITVTAEESNALDQDPWPTAGLDEQAARRQERGVA